MTDVIEGLTKEPEEIEYKPIDLASNWLAEEEDVEEIYVYAYEVTDITIKEFDLSDVQYLSITTFDEDYEVVDQENEWKMADNWLNAKFSVFSEERSIEVTEDIIVDETGSDNPNRWIDKIDNGKYRVGIKGGEVAEKFHIKIEFSTSANRHKVIHFPVDIIEIKDV